MSGEAVTILAFACALAGSFLRAVALDAAALLAMMILVVGGALTAPEALAGFGSPTFIVVACMFVLGEALQRSGAVRGLGTLIEHTAARGPSALLAVFLLPVMVLSAVVSNTAVVVVLLPITVAAARRAKTSPSRLLLPLSYASIAGGLLTLVGTSTTLLIDGLIRAAGMPPLGFFEVLPLGVAVCVVAWGYMVLVAPRVLPTRTGLVTASSPEPASEFLTEVLLRKNSRLVGRRLAESSALTRRIRFLQLIRGEETLWPPFQDQVLQSGDLLRVKGSPAHLASLLNEPGVSGPAVSESGDRVENVNLALAEVMIAPGSRFTDLTVREAALRDQFDVIVLAVQRRGAHLREHLGSLALRAGDVLLVQGTQDALDRVARYQDLIVLGGAAPPPLSRRRIVLTVALAVSGLLIGALEFLPISLALLVACIALVATRCLGAIEAYRSLNLRVLVVIGAMLAVGTAAQKTGLADVVASQLVDLGQRLGPLGLLTAVVLATSLLTELVTNAGTAVVMVPIALSVASQAGLSHRPFVMGVAVAASCSFLTPIGYQTNLLVHAPGGYRATDYLRLGGPLTVLVWILALLLIPLFYPFHP